MIKPIRIKGDLSGTTAMDVTFSSGVAKCFTAACVRAIRPTRDDFFSDEWDDVSGAGTNTLQFRSPADDGSLAIGEIDGFHARFQGHTTVANPNIVTKVKFSTSADTSLYYNPVGTADEKRDFHNKITGFTNNEYFDFTDLSFASLSIQTDVSQLRFTLTDFTVYKDLSFSNFNVYDYLDVSTGTLVYGPTTEIIDLANPLFVPLDSVNASGYALATASGMLIEDFLTGETYLLGAQAFASDVNTFGSSVPEPSAILLSTFGLLLLGFVGWRRRRR